MEKNKIYLGDCLEVMKEIPDKSVDMIRVFSDEHRRKISESCKGRKSWSQGKKMTKEHIPKCNGGSLLLENLQFISWLENRAKVDIGQQEWDLIKEKINEYF